jgi:chloride channel 3/4/5
VTVKDCLKYQFKIEASGNPRDEMRHAESQEKLWGWFRISATWISGQLDKVSGGRIRLGNGPGVAPDSRTPDPRDTMLDGTEDVEDNVELEDR